MTIRRYKLPFPPSLNHGHVRTKRGGRAPGKLVLRFRENVWAEVLSHGKRPPLEGRLIFTMHLFGSTKGQYDIDNFTKHTLDALELAGVFLDDEQFDQQHVYRCDVQPPGHVLVVIEEKI